MEHKTDVLTFQPMLAEVGRGCWLGRPPGGMPLTHCGDSGREGGLLLARSLCPGALCCHLVL